MAARAPKELNIMLVGKTGVGKSATGNSITGRKDVFKEDSGASVTKECKRETCKTFGERVFVIDTPGVCDTDEKDVLKIIDNFVSTGKLELHAICLVLSAANRPTKEEIGAIISLGELFGPAFLAYLLVVVTREEDLRRQKKTAKDFLLAYTDAGTELLKDCIKNDRVVGLANFDEDMKEKQVLTIIQKTKEICAKHNGALYTTRHFLENKKELQKKEEEIRRKEQELNDRQQRLQREEREAEKREAVRRARAEEQEKAEIRQQEERKALTQRFEQENSLWQLELDRMQQESHEQQRQLELCVQTAQWRQQEDQRRQQEEANRAREYQEGLNHAIQGLQIENMRQQQERERIWKEKEELEREKEELERRKSADEENRCRTKEMEEENSLFTSHTDEGSGNPERLFWCPPRSMPSLPGNINTAVETSKVAATLYARVLQLNTA